MDSDTLQVFQSELTCSICMNCFLDPVTIDCGHSFCRPCLSLCWEEGQTPRSCPECRGISERPDFKTNIVLKRLASLARQARADHDQSSEEQICVTHQEAKGLFCEADQTLLCGSCSEGPKHAAHSHSPIHRAAEESRVGDASRAVWDLESLGSVPSCRSESEQLHVPQPVVPELSVWPIPGLIDWLRQFQVYIVLNNEEVTHHLPVLEDLRCLLAGPDGPGVDDTPPRSKYFLAWGAESFTSGQHYWEVDVAGCCNWAIGLCNDSWARESDMTLDSKGIFLLLCIKENSQYSLFTSFPLLPQYVKKPLGQVGMFLDYDGGILSFIDVANSSLICSLLYCSFSSPLKPFLCSGYP
uniref:Tripartite motif-containing protein 64-like n=1 Tax=Moschus moschiferus TaxID=68415 RepID=A0A8C6D3W7_MOSMO